MGRKVHPIGFRLKINQPWMGRWYAEGRESTDQLHQDINIRNLIHKMPSEPALRGGSGTFSR